MARQYLSIRPLFDSYDTGMPIENTPTVCILIELSLFRQANKKACKDEWYITKGAVSKC
jgi:hypothetical protein